jgi:lysophospholipase L1-like esterase
MKILKIILALSLIFNVAALVFMATGGICYDEKHSVSKKLKSIVHRPKSTYFMGRDLIFEILPADSQAIVFLGDSHTEHFLLEELLGKEHLKNRGISGDRVKKMIPRLDPIVAMSPKKIFIQGGINDLGTGDSKEDLIRYYTELMDEITLKTPKSKVYLQSMFPTELKDGSTYCNPQVNKDIQVINEFLEQEARKRGFTYIEVYKSLAVNGLLNPDYSFDGIHLTAEGYLVWTKILKPYLEE